MGFSFHRQRTFLSKCLDRSSGLCGEPHNDSIAGAWEVVFLQCLCFSYNRTALWTSPTYYERGNVLKVNNTMLRITINHLNSAPSAKISPKTWSMEWVASVLTVVAPPVSHCHVPHSTLFSWLTIWIWQHGLSARIWVRRCPMTWNFTGVRSALNNITPKSFKARVGLQLECIVQ